VVLAYNVEGSWSIGFASEKFGLTVGETFPIDVTFDGQTKIHLFGTAITSVLVTAILPNNALLNQFRKSQLMVAEAKGATFQFKLTSTGRVIPTIENCVVKTKSAGIAKAVDFSLPIPPAVAKPVVQSATRTEPEAPSKPTKLIQKTGTGFAISTDGHVVTNHHVIDGCVGDSRKSPHGVMSATHKEAHRASGVLQT
jgi:S1-C subfamily serine protease